MMLPITANRPAIGLSPMTNDQSPMKGPFGVSFFANSCIYQKKNCTFAAVMKKAVILFLAIGCLLSCDKPSRLEAYRAQKHEKDSIGLFEQERTLSYYQKQLDALLPVSDSLIALFSYEKNEKYQDHGYYVIRNNRLKNPNYDLRVMVRDDGQDLIVYKEGKRLSDQQLADLRIKGNEALERADHLQIVISDVNELEKRIRKTNLEVQKYLKRLQKN